MFCFGIFWSLGRTLLQLAQASAKTLWTFFPDCCREPWKLVTVAFVFQIFRWRTFWLLGFAPIMKQTELPRCTKRTVLRIVRHYPNLYSIPKLKRYVEALKKSVWDSFMQSKSKRGWRLMDVGKCWGIRVGAEACWYCEQGGWSVGERKFWTGKFLQEP